MMTKEMLKKLIFPLPKQVTVQEGTLNLTKVALRVTADAHTAKQAGALIEKQLAKLGVEVCDCAETAITLALGEAPAEVSFADQAYSIKVTAAGAELTGFGAQGVFYAAVTFVQLLKSAEVPFCEILDWPDMEFRGQIMETRLGTDCMEKQDWFDMIDDFASQKINHLQVNVYGCWLVQYDHRVSEYLFVPLDGYPELKTPYHWKYYSPTEGKWIEADVLPPMFEKNFFGELIAYGYERGIKVFPGFNSYGHNTLIPHTYPELSAKTEDGGYSYSGFCTSNPDVYKLLFSAYDQLIDKYMKPYGSDCIALQLDEVWAEIGQYAGDIFSKRNPWCKCPKCRDLVEGELFVEHTVKLVKHLKEKGMKRVFICCDMLIDHGPNGVGVLTEPLLAALKREDVFDVVTITWWTYADLWEKLMWHTTQPETGLKRVTSPWNGYYHWSHVFHPVGNIYHMLKMAHASGAEAKRSYSSWDKSFHRPNQLQADWSWNFSGTGSMDDAKARYVRRYFPNSIQAATTAFDLWDDVTRITNTQDPKNTLSNRREMIFSFLVYYRYSYYMDGKDYPRNYPGELMPKLREDAAFCADLRAMLQQVEEAAALFEQVAKENPNSAELALRYRYEMMLYTAIFRDWTTLMDLDELAANYAESKDEAIIGQMADLAAAQKNFRLEVIALLENTKEDYLIPSHARNQTIPMQYYADLEAYLRNTPAKELKLDFADMRHMASETFMNLR